MAEKRRIGVLGGTFDPVHFGHLRTALDVQQELNLDKVLLIPVGDPAHRAAPAASAPHRYLMLQRALQQSAKLEVDAEELSRSGLSYTVDTLTALRERYGQETSLNLIVGLDAFRQFHEWHRAPDILCLANLVVVQRAGEQPLKPKLAGEPEALQALCAQAMTEHRETFLHATQGRILSLEVTQLAISATQIRRLLHNNQDPSYLLPEGVLDYIRQQQLYLSQTKFT